MKKAILIIASFLAIASTVDAQKKEVSTSVPIGNQNTTGIAANIPKDVKQTAVVKAGVDTLKMPIGIKIVVIDSVNFSIEVLKEYAAAVKQNKFPVYATAEWIADSYKFFRTAGSPGTNDIQMELLKAPLIPWLQYFDRLSKEQKK